MELMDAMGEMGRLAEIIQAGMQDGFSQEEKAAIVEQIDRVGRQLAELKDTLK